MGLRGGRRRGSGERGRGGGGGGEQLAVEVQVGAVSVPTALGGEPGVAAVHRALVHQAQVHVLVVGLDAEVVGELQPALYAAARVVAVHGDHRAVGRRRGGEERRGGRVGGGGVGVVVVVGGRGWAGGDGGAGAESRGRWGAAAGARRGTSRFECRPPESIGAARGFPPSVRCRRSGAAAPPPHGPSAAWRQWPAPKVWWFRPRGNVHSGHSDRPYPARLLRTKARYQRLRHRPRL